MKTHIKYFALLMTTIAPIMIAKLVVPLEWYTFRCWESLVDHRPDACKVGPFYPNKHIRRTEIGDIGPHSVFAIEKDAEWYTDAYGFRNRPVSEKEPYDIVVVGGSNIVGTSLTQADTLAEILSRDSGLRTYAYAPGSLTDFLQDERFIKKPPSVVVYAGIERYFHKLKTMKHIEEEDSEKQMQDRSSLMGKIYCYLLPGEIGIFLDRIWKKPAIVKYLIKTLTRKKNSGFIVNEEQKMLFTMEECTWAFYYHGHPEEAENVSTAVVQFKQEFDKRGICLIFLPIPDKAQIYYDFVPQKAGGLRVETDFLTKTIALLRREGIFAVDLHSAFSEARIQGEQMYHLDDTHWNARGVQIASKLIVEMLREINPLSAGPGI